MQQTSLPRVTSIDILRGITMVLMIFVNDLWSLNDIPAWLEHTTADVDGMGLADTVFPAFLFIVGMSVPFSVNSRRLKGESNRLITYHILQRSFALLVMGVFLVNGESINEAATGMPRSLWNTISCLCFIVLWNSYRPSADKRIIRVAKGLAILALMILAWIYRGGERHGNEMRFSVSWWGILGLIGWAYLVSALVFTFSGSRFVTMIIFWLLCLGCSISVHAGWIPATSPIRMITGPLGNGAMPALVTGGIITSMAFSRFQRINKPLRLIGYLLLMAAVFFLAGLYTRQFWGIAKLGATPAWVLICSAITIVVFVFVYWLADVNKKDNWFAWIKPAGTNTLLCYLMPYFGYALLYGILHNPYPMAISEGVTGLVKSLVFALVMVNIAGLLARYGVRLKL